MPHSNTAVKPRKIHQSWLYNFLLLVNNTFFPEVMLHLWVFFFTNVVYKSIFQLEATKKIPPWHMLYMNSYIIYKWVPERVFCVLNCKAKLLTIFLFLPFPKFSSVFDNTLYTDDISVCAVLVAAISWNSGSLPGQLTSLIRPYVLGDKRLRLAVLPISSQASWW